jgi:hypothetical protein
VGLGFRTQGHLETVILAEFSNFRKRKFLFLRLRRLRQLVARFCSN